MKKMKTSRLDEEYLGRLQGVKRMLVETGIEVNDSVILRSVILNGLENIENKLNNRLDNAQGNLAKD